ncbi:hypothetical protein EXS70_00440 [Candidatus Peribacteria bacterium]|nr:hypothetical protein [Candidatus Peribacteria bacterium]
MSTPPNIHRDEHDQQGENSTPSIPLEIESSTSAQSLLKPPEDIEAKIQHNHPVLGKDIHHFREELENTMVVVGGEKVSLPELKTNPEHKENIRIWKAVLSDEDTMEIEKMTLITEPVAEKIVHLNRGHFVYLVGLRKLTPETARILARSPKQLRLNELQSITPEVAKELARHAGDALWLCRLKDLSEDAAKELSKHRGYLNVAGLKTLSDGALAHLFKHEGKMNLANVTRFGNVDIDEFVRKYEDGESYINFGELEQITDAQLASLAKHTKSKSKYVGTHLKLGITVLSNTQAKFLENYGGELDFIRLRSISETGIVSLATGNKSVTLGVTQLTDRSAEALSKVSDNLSLWYLESMNDAQAESFSKHKGKLNLGKVSSLTDAQAQSLSRHDGEVYFSELRTISDLGIQALAKGKARIGGCSDLHIRIKKMRQEADLKD